MQSNTITLSVDAANDANPANQDFVRMREDLNRSTYHASGHSDSARDMLQIYRTDPKRSGESLGIRKSAVKITVDQSVSNASGSGNITLPLIGEVRFAVPVGTTDAEVIETAQRLLALLDTNSLVTSIATDGEI